MCVCVCVCLCVADVFPRSPLPGSLLCAALPPSPEPELLQLCLPLRGLSPARGATLRPRRAAGGGSSLPLRRLTRARCESRVQGPLLLQRALCKATRRASSLSAGLCFTLPPSLSASHLPLPPHSLSLSRYSTDGSSPSLLLPPSQPHQPHQVFIQKKRTPLGSVPSLRSHTEGRRGERATDGAREGERERAFSQTDILHVCE